MLRLIISPPGAGKTTCITEKIRAEAASSEGTAPLFPVLIVPEQSHFETERMIYKTLGARLACNTEVVSFTKLGAGIIAENKADKAPAADTVREITMLTAVRALRGTLRFYANAAEKPDFAARMLKTIENFQREGLSPEELSDAAKELKSARLRAKLNDLAAIYGRYNSLISENFSDRYDDIRIAAGIAFNENYFAGKSIYVDGFDGFSGAQFLLLDAAISQATSVAITLTADSVNSVLTHYQTTVKLAAKLTELAGKRKIKVVTEHVALFKERDPIPKAEIYLLPDMFAESGFVAAKIRELITAEKPLKQSDIAVLNAASPQTLSGALGAYGISEFADLPEAIIEKPMVRFIITALEAAQDRPGAMLAFIKSGFIRVWQGEEKSRRPTREETRLLTRAAHEFAIDTWEWHRAFPRGSVFEKAEPVRAEITAKLSALNARIKDTTGDEITVALTEFLFGDMELERTIADIIYDGTKVNTALNDEYRALWEKVVSILESLHAALESQAISAEDYTAILASIFGKTLTAKPPQVLDAVTVGDLRRTRTGDVKAVFLMGANRGEFPLYSTISGAEFTESETEELCTAGVFIEENRVEKYYRERFLIHRAMTLPTEKLFITAPLRDMAWKEKRASQFILDMKNNIKNAENLPLSFWASHRNALRFLAAQKPQDASLKRALSEIDPEESARFSALKRGKNYLHEIAPNAANALMKRESISPSRVELLNTCLFKYFCTEGLRVGAERVKNDAEPDALTRGSMTHYVLEKALAEHKNDDYERFMTLTPQELLKLTENYIAEFEESEFGGWARSARKREILTAHAAGIAEVLQQMREDMKLSGFRPYELEKQFEFMLGEVLIKGKTDRLDVLETPSASYIRVIDYKTGEKDFSYPEIEVGLNMQALIYLFAMASVNADCKPSGAFYRMVNGGRLSKGFKAYGAAETQSDLYKNRMETQKTTGIQFGCESREDAADIRVINAALSEKSGSPRKQFIKLTNLDEDEFQQLAEKAEKQLRERLFALYGGDVKALPSYGATSPCPYCDYKNICNNAGKREENKVSSRKETAE